MSPNPYNLNVDDLDDGYVSAEDQLAAPLPTAEQLSATPPQPDTLTSSTVSLASADHQEMLPSLDQFLKQLRDAAKRGPGRPRKRRAGPLPELDGVALLTPEQREARLVKIAGKLAAAEDEHTCLEARRGEVDVLDDTALDTYHADLARTEAVRVTLRAVHANHRAAIQRAEAAETNRAFEDRALRTIAENAELYATRLRELHDLTTRIAKLGPSLAEARTALEDVNALADARDRRDLKFSMEMLRSVIRRELGVTDLDTSPVEIMRMGESDAEWDARVLATLSARSRGQYNPDHSGRAATTNGREIKSRLRRAKEIFVERDEGEDGDVYSARLRASIAQHLNCHRSAAEDEDAYALRLRNALAHELKIERKGERDEAYQLRVGNARAQQRRPMERQDPLNDAAKAAVPIIEAHCATAAMWEKYRRDQNRRRFVRYHDSLAQPAAKPAYPEEELRGVARLG